MKMNVNGKFKKGVGIPCLSVQFSDVHLIFSTCLKCYDISIIVKDLLRFIYAI